MSNLNIFKHSTDVVSFPAGHTIFSQGDQGDAMYVVKEGAVDIIVDDCVLETVGEGGIFGELALVDHEYRSASAVTRSASTLVPVDGKRFERLVAEAPFFALNVISVLAGRLRRQTS